MTELESLALLIADLNAQVRALQQENAALKAAQRPPGGSTDPNPHDNVMPC